MARLAGIYVRGSVVLDQAEFVLFEVGHHNDHPFVEVVPLAGEPTSEGDDLGDALVDVVDHDVQVQACLAVLRLGHRLEVKAGLRVAGLAEVDPAGSGRQPRAVQQCAPGDGERLT